MRFQRPGLKAMAVQERIHEGIRCPYSEVAASVSRDDWRQQPLDRVTV